MIRMDFTTSGWSTPRRFPTIETNYGINSEVLARRTERLLSTTDGLSRTRLEARRLEDKVAKVAAKKCSVEEVSALHKELEDWCVLHFCPFDSLLTHSVSIRLRLSTSAPPSCVPSSSTTWPTPKPAKAQKRRRARTKSRSQSSNTVTRDSIRSYAGESSVERLKIFSCLTNCRRSSRILVVNSQVSQTLSLLLVPRLTSL
jgi:hypothetical protein